MTDIDTATPQQVVRTLKLAWVVWSALVVLTLGALAATVFVIYSNSPKDAASATVVRWLWIILAYYLVVVTGSFFATGWLFRGYHNYTPVPPRSYLRGMAIVWVALAVGAWMSLGVCLVTRTFLPNILFAGVGTVMLLLLWPKGNAMAPPAADPRDPGRYKEPR